MTVSVATTTSKLILPSELETRLAALEAAIVRPVRRDLVLINLNELEIAADNIAEATGSRISAVSVLRAMVDHLGGNNDTAA